MGNLIKFDHVKFWVANAKQASDWYCSFFGFIPIAYRGFKTGSRQTVCHVAKQGQIIFAFESSLTPDNAAFGEFLCRHGDAVRDVAFQVKNIAAIVEAAVLGGAEIVAPLETTLDELGSVQMCTIKTYGSVHHTLIDRSEYGGCFLPNYQQLPHSSRPCTEVSMLSPNLETIDHVVGNQTEFQISSVAEWYERILKLRRFWSIDEKDCSSQYSAMRANLVGNESNSIKLVGVEPVSSSNKLGTSQAQEFLNYNDGPGVQHIGLMTNDIISTVTALRSRGVQFLSVPPSYYDQLECRLATAKITVVENLSSIRKLEILVDFDDKGYLLQIFTKPVQDRPTFFLEVIQRHNFSGFGAGNFKALFDAVELEQRRRGTLFSQQ